MISAGIDNGLSGAIVILDQRGDVAAQYRMPRYEYKLRSGKTKGRVCYRALKNIFLRHDVDLIGLERPAGSKNSNAAKSMAASFATTDCACIGALQKMGKDDELDRLRHVLATDWQRFYWGHGTKGGTKALAYQSAGKVWPDFDEWITKTGGPRSKVIHDGVIDAALIARYVWDSARMRKVAG